MTSKNNFLFEKEIRMFGLKRSGLHAANAWVWHYFKPGSVMYQNNTALTFKERQQYNTFDEYFGLLESTPQCYINLIEHLDPQKVHQKLSDPNYEYNTEKKEIAARYEKKYFSKEEYNIVVLRSPFNNLASIAQDRGNNSFRKQSAFSFKEMWMKYAYELIGTTNFFSPGKVPFLFDEWFVNKEYRKNLASLLGLEFTDLGLNEVTRRGSSFDKKRYHGKAQEMNVLNRWSQIDEEKRQFYGSVIDKEVIDLWENVKGGL